MNNSAVKRFVIYAHARSGSSMLMSSLRQHRALCTHGEALHPNTIEDKLPGYKAGQNPVPFIEEHLFKPESPSHRVVGFKFFPEHADVSPSMYPVWGWLKRHPDLRFICLHRENLLRYHASQLIALEQGRWKARSPEERSNITVTVEPVHAARVFAYRERTRQWAEQHLPMDRVLAISYEQLAEAPQAFFRQAQIHLGLDPQELQVITLQQELRQLADIITNYDELVRRWRDTPWAAFLE
jgi:LPS sulfotransferase NodH